MTKYNIALLPGDGIGPEVVDATVKVMDALQKKTDIEFEYKTYMIGDAEKKRSGTALPQATIDGVKEADACLFACVGETAKETILPLRQMFNLYANLRPAKAYPGVPAVRPETDIMMVRENTEGIYKMIGHRSPRSAFNVRVITWEASERIVRYAFEWAKKNGKKKVTAIHKSNVLDYTDGLFLEASRSVAAEYPEMEYNELIVDAASMWLVMYPESFEVVVTTNMFGDILSDVTAGLVGGLGMAPSGNVGDDMCIFEPVHGSAPDIAGKGIANPAACMLSAAMMLEWLGENKAAKLIEDAVLKVLKEGKTLTPDLKGKATTVEFAEAVAKAL
ncbi:MAG: isocitrate/isopropylmalate dehydrogenase family protein [Candidatus Bathyarchaeota archaeon]|nr:isocitrate/isopropylmalate dehydrogenase family protein [Candidatus Bathyarchaeota archaeon]